MTEQEACAHGERTMSPSLVDPHLPDLFAGAMWQCSASAPPLPDLLSGVMGLSSATLLPASTSSATPLTSSPPRQLRPGPHFWKHLKQCKPSGNDPCVEAYLAEETSLDIAHGVRVGGTPRPASSLRRPIYVDTHVDTEESFANVSNASGPRVPKSPMELRSKRSYYHAWHCRALGLQSAHPATGLESWGKEESSHQVGDVARARRSLLSADKLPEEDILEYPDVVIHSEATTDLIAACAAVQQRKHDKKLLISPPSCRRDAISHRGRSGSRKQSRTLSKRYVRGRRLSTREMRMEELEKAAKAKANMERVRMAKEGFFDARLEEVRERKCKYYAIVFGEELRRWLALSTEAAWKREARRAAMEERERLWRERTHPTLDAVAKAKAAEQKRKVAEKAALANKITNVVSDLNSYLETETHYSDDEDTSVRDAISDESNLDVSISPRSLTPAVTAGQLRAALKSSHSSDTASPPPRSASASRTSNTSRPQQRSISPPKTTDDTRRTSPPRSTVPSKNVSAFSSASSAVAISPQRPQVRAQQWTQHFPQQPAQRTESHIKKQLAQKPLPQKCLSLEQAALNVRTVLLGELRRQMMEAASAKEAQASSTEEADATADEPRNLHIAFAGEVLPKGAVESTYVRDHYAMLCKFHLCKPNSKAMEHLTDCHMSVDMDGTPGMVYDFSNALLGDRGCVCLLHALAEDPHCAMLSLKGCGLKGASVVAIAAFLELHPRLRHLDLSMNSFSYDAGEQILDALMRRSRGQSRDEEHSNTPGVLPDLPAAAAREHLPKLRQVTINLSGTWFAWDRAGQLTTSGPPCGNLWAAHAVDSQRRFAPSGYERLRNQLDETHHIQYENNLDKAGPPEAVIEIEEADAAKNRLSLPETGVTDKLVTKRNTANPESFRPCAHVGISLRTRKYSAVKGV